MNEIELQVDENSLESKRAFELANAKIIEHSLDMKLVDVEYTFDRNKIIFYFTAEGRVDFRELVKDLASVFSVHVLNCVKLEYVMRQNFLAVSVHVDECYAVQHF